MATKAQLFKAAQQRKAAKERSSDEKRPSKPQVRKRGDEEVDTSEPGVSASDRKVGAKSTATRNVSNRAAKKARAVLEESESGTPSRKSTRKSGTRTKSASRLERKVAGKSTSPSARARRSQAGRRPGGAGSSSAGR